MLSRQKRKCYCVITTVTVMLLLLAPMNMHLVQKRNDCVKEQIDTNVLGTVVNVSGGYATYDVGFNCTIEVHPDTPIPIVGSQIFMYRNDEGLCSLKEENDMCDVGLVVFNMFAFIATLFLCWSQKIMWKLEQD